MARYNLPGDTGFWLSWKVLLASVEDTYMATRDLKNMSRPGIPPESLNESQSQQGKGYSEKGKPSLYHLTIQKRVQWLSCAGLCA